MKDPIQLMNYSLQNDILNDNNNYYFNDGLWSPDGNFILTNSNDRIIRSFQWNNFENKNELNYKLKLKRSNPITSFTWYPFMNINEPISNCFLIGMKDYPIQLINGYDGQIRATYPIINHQEKFIGPNTMEFNYNGAKLYCGYKDSIQIIDISQPGSSGNLQKLSESKKNNLNGQRGIVSCIKFNPYHNQQFMVGTFLNNIGIYDERDDNINNLNLPSLKLNIKEGNGITHIKYNLENEYKVYISSRQSNLILEYDLRNIQLPSLKLTRECNNNQRMKFDIKENLLFTGDKNGNLLVYNLNRNGELLLNLNYFHKTSIGTIAFHPFLNQMLSLSGMKLINNDNNNLNSQLMIHHFDLSLK